MTKEVNTRPIRYINNCLYKKKVKDEDWKVAFIDFKQGAYMFSFDLKSGYDL